ncbi:MAG: bifunctional (p)ppGpp synthetase/guanosine-3',5'-bis(diphosphate) 3'-pyrophosphohydrolase [Gammaproteobacteria bacterium]|nr:bifunctional (p)ppGpp synthetase/guanosine-3',5'-bis(diphosphate) 3'-pyrophosphohydrolase [Gammaproteobacteria bacterium]
MKMNYVFNPDASWGRAAIAQLEIAHQLVEEGRSSRVDLADELAGILNQLNVDYELIVAGFLYEAFDGELARQAAIEARLGARIGQSYGEMCRLLDVNAPWLSGADLKSGGHQLMLLSMMKDVRLAFLLLGHQLLRMRHLKGAPADMIKREAAFTRYVFAPMANRLGIGQLKWELEDLAFRFSQPEEYKRIASALEERRVDRERYIQQVVGELSYALQAAHIQAKVYGRPKHLFSIWKKMQNKDLDFKDLYDVRALRVMVDDITQCYAALSVVHTVWPFVHGEYDDYIAAPKANGYQSLHTAVHGPEGKTIEVQIRTHEMHEFAELGVAAHWRYKEGGSSKRDEALEKRIESLRMMLSGDVCPVPGLEDSRDEAHIYVLTPQGKVVELVAGATPLDFSYSVHTELGHRCRGAKVNGQMVPLTTPLSSGQEVEIITAKEARPSRDWLVPHFGYLKTSRARSKVKAWFRAQFRREHIESGKGTLQKEVGKDKLAGWPWDALCKRFNYQTAEDIYAAVGRGELGLQQLLHAVEDLQPETQPMQDDDVHLTKATLNSGKVVVQGVGDLMTSLARCCKPMPGDDVVGFITRGRGVTVHRRSCSNVEHMRALEPERFIDIHWGGRGSFEVDIEIEAMDRSGLLRDVTSVLAGEEVNVLAVNTHSDRKVHSAHMRLTLEVRGGDHLNRALARLLQIQSVLEARRVSK